MLSQKKGVKQTKAKKADSQKAPDGIKRAGKSAHLPPKKEKRTPRGSIKASASPAATFKRRQEPLQKSEERYRSLFNQARVGIVIINLQTGQILDCNPEFQHLSGRKLKQLKKMKIWELRPPGKVEAAKKKFFEVKQKGTGGSRELEFQRPNGELVAIEFVSRVVRIRNQQYIQSLVRDITERKRAEKALKERTDQLNERVKELNCLYSTSNLIEKQDISIEEILQGAVELMPPAWLYPKITCARIILGDLIFKTNNFQETIWKQASDIIVHGDPVGRLEVCYLEEKPQRDEGPFIAEERSLINAVAERLGKIMERKRAEEEIQKLNESLKLQASELTTANMELEAFSYSVSHDLRAPLRAIDGFCRALQEDYANKLDQQGKDYLRRVCAAIQHMRELIDDLLNLSLLMRAQMRHEKINLSEMVQAITAELQKNKSERRVEFVIQQDVIAYGDGRLLREVLENLLGNAWKFTEKHSKAKIEFGAVHKEGQRIYLVRDDGAGFDMTYANKLFIPFQRLHSTAEFSGNGIGLTIASRIINRHGGRIWAEGEVEKGATFYFTLG